MCINFGPELQGGGWAGGGEGRVGVGGREEGRGGAGRGGGVGREEEQPPR